MASTLTPRQQEVADRKAAGVWLTIPYEQSAVRAKAKAAGALWEPSRKQWSVPAVAADEIKAMLGETEGVEVKTFRFNDFYMASSFVSGKSSELGDVWEGDVARDRDGTAWVVLSRSDRRRHEEENDEWYTDSTVKARPATEDEVATLDAEEADKAARAEELRAARALLVASQQKLEAAQCKSAHVRKDLPVDNESECLTIESTAMGSMYGQATYANIENDSESPRRILLHFYNADMDAVAETMIPLGWTQELDDAVRVMAKTVGEKRALGSY